MSRRIDSLSRAQLIGGMIATGALAACGGGANTIAVPSASPTCSMLPPNLARDRFGVSEIFSNEFFNGLDKQALLDAFDPSPGIDRNQQGYLAQVGQQLQSANVVSQIPSEGVVIRSPGKYTFGGNILWSPNNGTSSAITIQCSDVTLDLAGFTLKASVSDKSQQITGILVQGPVENITITNGIVAAATEYGILATNVCGLNISGITATGLCMKNLAIRNLTPTGIEVSSSHDVTISNCSVTALGVTTDSSAGIQLVDTSQAIVTGCRTIGLLNTDGAVQGFSLIGCNYVATSECTAETLESQNINQNYKTTGHTVLGFIPIFCMNLSYVNCSASGLSGGVDDCHGMSVFLNKHVTVSGFHANNVLDGAPPYNTGAKATGLEVYGSNVTVTDSTANNITANYPQDKQATGFSAWGNDIQFVRCKASTVVVQDGNGGSRGTGFGWAPDPRLEFAYIGALRVAHIDCTAEGCDVGFDTWYHVDSSWIRPVYTNCTVHILVEPVGTTRTISCDAGTECTVPITATLINFASGNTYPPP